MARLIEPPHKFTHDEWKFSNNVKYRAAEKIREISEGFQNECDRFIEETDKRTEKTLKDVNKKIGKLFLMQCVLDQRLDDVKHWKDEIDKKLDELVKETDELDKNFIRLSKTFESTEEYLHISQQCLINRLVLKKYAFLSDGRHGIDLVYEDAQKELIKEVETIKGVRSLLEKTLDQCKEQLRYKLF